MLSKIQLFSFSDWIRLRWCDMYPSRPGLQWHSQLQIRLGRRVLYRPWSNYSSRFYLTTCHPHSHTTHSHSHGYGSWHGMEPHSHPKGRQGRTGSLFQKSSRVKSRRSGGPRTAYFGSTSASNEGSCSPWFFFIRRPWWWCRQWRLLCSWWWVPFQLAVLTRRPNLACQTSSRPSVQHVCSILTTTEDWCTYQSRSCYGLSRH